MNRNYAAWDVAPEKFFDLPPGRDQLRFLVQFAVLAPSSHNSQPWRFSVEDDRILLFPEDSRALPISDPSGRHAYLGLGAALQNLVVAADYFGFSAEVRSILQREEEPAAEVLFSGKPARRKPDPHLIACIASRRTNRKKYESRLPEPAVTDRLRDSATEDAGVTFVSAQPDKEKIASFLIASRVAAFANPDFRMEMARYKRTNFTRSPVGMPGFTMEFGGVASLFTAFAIRRWNVMKFIRAKEEALLTRHTPLFAFISSKEDSRKGWLAAGRVMQDVALRAESFGLRSAISALPPDRSPLKAMLAIEQQPQVFIRIGYSKSIPNHSPRLDAAEVIA